MAPNSFKKKTVSNPVIPEMFAPDLAPNGRGSDVVGGEEEEEEEGEEEAHNGSRPWKEIPLPSSKVQNWPK